MMNTEQVMKILSNAWKAMQPWAQRNVTFSLVLAVFTEVPRWVFAFDAINEPLWAGVPLAVLIAFATAHAWEEYFARYDGLLLCLNLVSLIFAVFTIAPVLYTMIDRTVDDVPVHLGIADVFSPLVQGLWVTVLACTTFLPLIQLAVVDARRRGLQAFPVVSVPTQLDAPVFAQIVAEPDNVPALDGLESDDAIESSEEETQVDTQLVEIDSTLPSQLDEMNQRILDSIAAGNYTPYAISKDTGIAQTTLKRKDGDTHTGRIPQLVAMGLIHNSSGVDGKEYRLATQ